MRVIDPHQAVDPVVVRIDHPSAALRGRPDIVAGRVLSDWQDVVDRVGAERLVEAARPDVRHHPGQARREFPLDVHVVLIDVVALRVWLDIRGAKRPGTQLIEARGWKRALREIVRRLSELEIRRSKQHGQLVQVWKRKNVEHSDAAADRRLAAACGIPGKPHSRFEVLQCRVVEVRIPRMRHRVAHVPQRRQLTACLRGNGGHLVSEPQIQREIWFRPIIVVEIPANDPLTHVARRDGAGNRGAEVPGDVEQEILEAAEVPHAIRVGNTAHL